MISRKKIVCLYLLCIETAVVPVHGEFSVVPSNKAVIAEQRMQMECRADNESQVFKWTLTKPTSHRKDWILRRSGNKETLYIRHFNYDLDERGSGFIFTNSTEPGDAGIYFCYINPGQLQSSAHLIVFESEPICEVNFTSNDDIRNMTFDLGDQISLRCRVSFRGLWTPSLEWRQHPADGSEGDEGEVIRGVSTVTSINNTHLTSSLEVVADFHKLTFFSFRIFFSWRDDVIPVNATNLPDFQYVWRSPEMIAVLPEIETAKPPVAVQVIVETVTNEVNSAGEWYLISSVLLVTLLVIVFSIFGFVVRRCYIGCRRVNGLGQNSSPGNASVPNRIETTDSDDYDVIPTVIPNIYDRIEDCEAKEKVPDTKCQGHPPLTHCYSGLSDATMTFPDPYDALSHYLPMCSHSHEPEKCSLPSNDGSEKENSGSLYTKVDENATTGVNTDDYLTLVGEGEEPEKRRTSAISISNKEIAEYVSVEDSVNGFAKTSDEYLIPFE